MFKENKDFWLYLVGIIIMFIFVFFGIRSYMDDNGIELSSADLIPNIYTTTDTPSNNVVEVVDVTEIPKNPLDVDKDYYAVIKTNEGDFTVELFEKNAPKAVANFIALSIKDYYDGTKFHRLIPNVLLQGGSRNTLNDDPTDDRFGDAGYIFADEINWDSLDYSQDLRDKLTSEGYTSAFTIASKDVAKYRLAMASTGPDQNSSQFFIIMGDKVSPTVDALRGRHTVFAEVTDNFSLLASFNKYKSVEPDSHLEKDIIIEDVNVYVR